MESGYPSLPGPYLSDSNYIMEMGSTETVHGIVYCIRFVMEGLVWISPHKPIPAWQKCLLTCCPASNPSSIRPDQLDPR
jgi:hypothetical protein